MSIPTECKIAGAIVFALGLAVLAFWMGGHFYEAIEIGKDCRSEGRFGHLSLMLLAYHDEHGRFPPTKYQAIENGPIHSWRMLLVPDIDADCKRLYSEYDFSETWNSPKNLAVAESLERNLGHFSMPYGGSATANYLAIGDGEDWPSGKSLKARLITKGKDRFLLVEYPDSKIYWAEPEY